jgi:hypothetical protein
VPHPSGAVPQTRSKQASGLGTQAQVKSVWHVWGRLQLPHVGPQAPRQTHIFCSLQIRSAEQVPQDTGSQSWPVEAVPHCWVPQASALVLQRQRPSPQTCPVGHDPQLT